jgi:sigma-B regulation protein RsbU (phosphoserine phosphatase)
VSDHAVSQTRGFLSRAVPAATTLGNLADLGLATNEPQTLARQLSAVLKANRGFSWVSYSDEAGSFVGAYRTPSGNLRVNLSRIVGGKTAMVEYDLVPPGASGAVSGNGPGLASGSGSGPADDVWMLHREEADTGYDPRNRPFYAAARAAGHVVWPPPYIFYEQSVPGVTCAKPLYGKDGKLQGVLTVDFDLNMLSQFVQQLKISPNSRLFIMSDDGVLLAHPTHRLQVEPGHRDRGELLKIHELNDPLIEAFDAQLTPADRTIGTGGTDRARQFTFRQANVDYFARATAFTIDGDLVWIVGAVAPQSDFLGAARRSSAMSLAASLGALVLAVGVAMLLARRVSGPILSLVSFMRSVGDGNLDSRAEFGRTPEFRKLSAALNEMIAGLRDRTRLRDSLAVAMEVQQRLLPDHPPRVGGLDLAGFSIYCDETGGDYYDYLVPESAPPGSVMVTIGDVMGHGIASALVMATVRGVLHSRASTCGHLGELLTHINDILVAGCCGGRRFVTMLLCMIDPAGLTLRWASAGHDPAILYDPATDSFENAGQGELPLGIDPGVTYIERAIELRRGQIIVLGTDGVWDTVNEAGELFDKHRLHASIRAAAALPAFEIAARVRQDLESFRGRTHQRDDVTLVVVKMLSVPAASKPRESADIGAAG